jgi:hypothetical protein
MLITVLTLSLALMSLTITFVSRKISEQDKPKYLVWGNVFCLALIVILNSVNQINSSASDKAYKRVVFELEVLSKVNELAMPVFKNYAEITNNFNAIKNYIYQEEAKALNPDAISLIEQQQEKIRAQQSFQDATKALSELKLIARQVHMLNMQYQDTIPSEVIEWAKIIQEVKLVELDLYFDPYARNRDLPEASVISFFQMSTHAFGLCIDRARQASETLNSLIE